MDGVTSVINAFRPGRAYRRRMAGIKCSMCGLGITAPDLALVTVELHGVRDETRPIHQQCTALLWDLQDQLRRLSDTSTPDANTPDPG
jgi:hypothetical protein